MRILCLLNRDLASCTALNLLLPALAPHDARVGLTERLRSEAPSAEPAGRTELRRAEQGVPNEVVFPLVERAGFADDGRRRLTFGEVERHRGIPVRPLPNPNAGEGLAWVQAFAPDVIVSIRYGVILKAPLIAVPPLGVLNLHSGLLPAYRGVLATFRALMAGDAEIGCTLHRIEDRTIDTGAVIAQARVAVRRDRSLLGHILALYPGGARLVADALARLAAGEALAVEPQAESGGAYYTWPTEDEWAAFAARGWTVARVGDVEEALRPYLPEGAPLDG